MSCKNCVFWKKGITAFPTNNDRFGVCFCVDNDEKYKKWTERHYTCNHWIGKLKPGERFEKWIPAKEESHRTMDEDYIKRELEKLPITIECRFGIQYMDWDKVHKELQELLRKNIALMDEDMRKQKWQFRLRHWFVSKLEALADKLSE